VNREAELDRPSRVACSALLGDVVIIIFFCFLNVSKNQQAQEEITGCKAWYEIIDEDLACVVEFRISALYINENHQAKTCDEPRDYAGNA
jgi:hypothetical protein